MGATYYVSVTTDGLLEQHDHNTVQGAHLQRLCPAEPPKSRRDSAIFVVIKALAAAVFSRKCGDTWVHACTRALQITRLPEKGSTCISYTKAIKVSSEG